MIDDYYTPPAEAPAVHDTQPKTEMIAPDEGTIYVGLDGTPYRGQAESDNVVSVWPADIPTLQAQGWTFRYPPDQGSDQEPTEPEDTPDTPAPAEATTQARRAKAEKA